MLVALDSFMPGNESARRCLAQSIVHVRKLGFLSIGEAPQDCR
jgi:hypothetical protein